MVVESSFFMKSRVERNGNETSIITRSTLLLRRNQSEGSDDPNPHKTLLFLIFHQFPNLMSITSITPDPVPFSAGTTARRPVDG